MEVNPPHKCRVSICLDTTFSNESFWSQQHVNRFTFKLEDLITENITKLLKSKNLLDDWKKYCVSQGKTSQEYVSWSYKNHYDYEIRVVPKTHKDKLGKVNHHLPIDTGCVSWQNKLNKILREDDVIYVTFDWKPATVAAEVDKTALENGKDSPVDNSDVQDV